MDAALPGGGGGSSCAGGSGACVCDLCSVNRVNRGCCLRVFSLESDRKRSHFAAKLTEAAVFALI